MKICELKIQIGHDRERIICALVNAGYKVSLDERKPKHWNHSCPKYWLVVEKGEGTVK